MEETNLTDALDECLVTKRSRLKGKRLRMAQLVQKLLRVVPSPEAKAAGRQRLLSGVAKKRREQARQAQESLREVA